jgi:hypothetical protein
MRRGTLARRIAQWAVRTRPRGVGGIITASLANDGFDECRFNARVFLGRQKRLCQIAAEKQGGV